MTYSRAGNGLIIIDHTDVPAALRGRKVGERTVRQAVEDARRDGVAIIPLCPFAKAQIDSPSGMAGRTPPVLSPSPLARSGSAAAVRR